MRPTAFSKIRPAAERWLRHRDSADLIFPCCTKSFILSMKLFSILPLALIASQRSIIRNRVAKNMSRRGIITHPPFITKSNKEIPEAEAAVVATESTAVCA